MNTVTVNPLNQKESIISFKDEAGHEMCFGLTKGSNTAFVWEQKCVGNNIMAKPDTLSVNWLKPAVQAGIDLLKDDGVYLMKTPLGGRFAFSKTDLIALRDFIQNQTQQAS